MLKKIIFPVLTLSVLGAFAPGALAYDVRPVMSSGLVLRVSDDKQLESAKQFVDSVSQRGINFLADVNLSHDQRKGEFKKLLQSSFDTSTIGRFALGRYWKSASAQQQKEYLKLFDTMIVEIYSNRFRDYKGQDLRVQGARTDGEKGDILVSSIIVSDVDNSKISVDWRVRPSGGSYRIIDVIVEGVSMALTQRSDFASVIQRGGGNIDVLLDHMRGES